MADHRIQKLLAAVAVGFPLLFTATAHADEAPLCDPQFIDANQMCQFHASGVFSDIDMAFPANYPGEQEVLDYLRGVLNNYTDASGAATTRTTPNTLHVEGTRYSSGQPQTGTQSVSLKIYQNLGGPHPTTWFKAFTENTSTAKSITFDTLFRPGSKPLDVITPIVQQNLIERYGAAATIEPEQGYNPANYQNFAITNDSVIFFFDQNALVPTLEATEVAIPRTAISTLISPGIA